MNKKVLSLVMLLCVMPCVASKHDRTVKSNYARSRNITFLVVTGFVLGALSLSTIPEGQEPINFGPYDHYPWIRHPQLSYERGKEWSKEVNTKNQFSEDIEKRKKKKGNG